MTKEEIIDGLYRGDSRAIKEAIKVLEQRPSNEDVQRVVDYLLKPKSKPTSDDCVSRADLIDELNRLGRNAFKDDTDYDNFFAFVDSLPPVTPTQSWIPIITREPTEEEKKDYFEQNGEELCYMIDSPMKKKEVLKMVAIKDMEMPKSCYECDLHNYHNCDLTNDGIEKYLDDVKHPNCPLVEIELLTDSEQRIFLSAMSREMSICKQIDNDKVDDSTVKKLVPIVNSIERKVKKTLWD